MYIPAPPWKMLCEISPSPFPLTHSYYLSPTPPKHPVAFTNNHTCIHALTLSFASKLTRAAISSCRQPSLPSLLAHVAAVWPLYTHRKRDTNTDADTERKMREKRERWIKMKGSKSERRCEKKKAHILTRISPHTLTAELGSKTSADYQRSNKAETKKKNRRRRRRRRKRRRRKGRKQQKRKISIFQ